MVVEGNGGGGGGGGEEGDDGLICTTRKCKGKIWIAFGFWTWWFMTSK